jgi:hypothetical protein
MLLVQRQQQRSAMAPPVAAWLTLNAQLIDQAQVSGLRLFLARSTIMSQWRMAGARSTAHHTKGVGSAPAAPAQV